METTIDGQDYRVERLPTMDQFHVARRVAPLLPIRSRKVADAALQQTSDDFGVSIALSRLSQDDSDYVVKTCLRSCSLRQGKAWQAVLRNGELMFDDITLATMMALVRLALAESLGGFFPELPSPALGNHPTAETPPPA